MVRPIFLFVFVLAVIAAGCGSSREVLYNDRPGQSAAVKYSVIYYIHADAGYLYHDSDGQPVRANSRVLAAALEVAENAGSGEVFIFHQRPEKKFLGLFPRKSSRLYHYRKGRKSTMVRYRHSDRSEPFLTTEANLYGQYRTGIPQEDLRQYFLYFGHEVPKVRGTSYHRTLPGIEVHTASFSGGLRQFLTNDEQKFDLVVLSTCNNGTPAMADQLTPMAELLLASPQNLHLSHIDSDSMALLEKVPGTSPEALARAMAGQTYRRLSATIQTAVTLSLYDLDLVESYIDELHTSVAANERPAPLNLVQDYEDCAQYPFFNDRKFKTGVETWYKPARFGRRGKTETHSGWGCRPSTAF